MPRHVLTRLLCALALVLFPSAAFAQLIPPAFELYCECQLNGPCGNDAPTGHFGGCFNSTGSKCYLGPNSGGVSVSADDLLLVAGNLPASQPGLFYMGAGQTEITFGDGLRCVSPGALGIHRFPITIGDPWGSVTLGPGIVQHSLTSFAASGHISAGQTWNFQYWYRDPAGPCGTSFNLSTGVGVTFAP